MKKYLIIGILSIPLVAFSQTFNGSGGIIVDDATTDYTLSVTGAGTVLDHNYGLETVCLNIQHTYDSNLELKLISPDGTTILLFSELGGDDNNFTNTCLNQSAATAITTASAPFTGTFRPMTDLGFLNNGQNPNGTWILRVRDNRQLDIGILLSWSVTLSNNPAAPFSSDLPLVLLNTGGVTIPDEPKMDATIKMVNNTSGRNYITGPFQFEGDIGIEQRGSSSAFFEKKSYGFETEDDVTLLGMPSESDWILSANHSDKSLMNNVLAYHIFRDMGHYAPRTKYCELLLNGEYVGVYVFTEKIKRNKNRVDIPKLNPVDNSGDKVTGGYIVKIDKTTGNPSGEWISDVTSVNGVQIRYQFEYPKYGNITAAQQDYIQNYIDEFESNLNGPDFADPVTGYRKYIRLQDFIDYMILNEVSRNVDGYRLSTFIYKERITDGNKLSLVPWDYDLGFGNANYCNGADVTGWAYDFPMVCSEDPNQVPFWWNRLMQDPAFRNELQCRYQYLRAGVLSTSRLHSVIDSMATVLSEGQIRNFQKYDVLGEYVWPNPLPVPQDYAGEVTELKNWLTDRLNWMDANLPGTCIPTGVYNPHAGKSWVTAFPNPANSSVTLSWTSDRTETFEIILMSSIGEVLYTGTLDTHAGENAYKINLDGAAPGIYMIHLHNGRISEQVKVVRTSIF